MEFTEEAVHVLQRDETAGGSIFYGDLCGNGQYLICDESFDGLDPVDAPGGEEPVRDLKSWSGT